MADLKEIKVSIRTYTAKLSELIAADPVFYEGQIVWAIDDVTGSNKKGLKVGEWDPKKQAKDLAPKFQDLDWIVSPAASGSGGYTPFSIEAGDDEYNDNGTDTIITDDRLLGVTKLIVTSTYRNTIVRKSEMAVDPALGQLTLFGFTGMPAGEQICIFTPSAIVVSATLTALENRIKWLEFYRRPFSEGGGKVLFEKPAIFIPEGWREWTAIRGMFPMPQDSTAPVGGLVSFNVPVGTTGGNKTHKIANTNFLPRHRFYTVVDQQANIPNHPLGRAISAIRSMIRHYYKSDIIPLGGTETYELCGSESDNQEPTQSPTSWVGQTVPDDINHMNPYRIVLYIEPDPEYIP
jgi:hypothetical protein